MTPTGVARFYVDNVSYGVPLTISGNSVSTIYTSGFLPGPHSVGVTYGGDINFNTQSYTSNQITFTLNQIVVTTTPASPIVSGQPISLHAAITGGTNVTGTVNFFDNGVIVNPSPVQVIANQADFGPYSGFLANGSPHAVTAVYSGDSANFGTNNNASPFLLTVNKGSTTISTPVMTGTPVVGFSLTFSMTVAPVPPASGTPTGSVTFFDGATAICIGNLLGGAASCSTSALAAGSHTIYAVYNGDVHFLGSTSGSLPVSIAKLPSSVQLNYTVNSGSTTLTAIVTVLGGSAPPTGTVQFSNGSTVLGTAALSGGSGNTASATLVAASVLSGTVTADYSGSSTVDASSASVVISITKLSSSVQVNYTLGSSSTTLTAIVTVLGGSAPPTGTVQFSNGPTVLGTVALSGGSGNTASATLVVPSVLSGTVTADYSGSSTVNGSSASVAIVNTKLNSSVQLTYTLGSTSTTLTAVVTALGGSTPPTGTVQFFNGPTTLGTVALGGGSGNSASAVLVVPSVLSGTITATYSGSSTVNGSTGSVVIGNSQSSQFPPVTLLITATPNPPTSGNPVTFTVVIQGGPSQYTPTGTMQFLDGTALLGTVPVQQGQAKFTIALSAGTHSIVVNYSGDSWFPSASDIYGITVGKYAATLTLASSSLPSWIGQSVVLTATVASQSQGVPQPAGQVEFREGGALLGSVPLVNGTASITLSNLTVGSHSITAIYGGDGNYGSAWATLVQLVQKFPTSISVKVSGSGPQASLVATLSASIGAGGIPTGSVQFVDAGTGELLAMGNLTAGVVTVPAPNTAGRVIVASYPGDSTFQSSNSAPIPQFAVVNSASYLEKDLVPDEIVTVFSPALAAGPMQAQAPLPNSLGGVSVTLTDSSGKVRQTVLFYVSQTQLSFLAPSDAPAGPATLAIQTAAGGLLTAVVNMASVAPGLYAAGADAGGVAAAQVVRVHADGSQEVSSAAQYDAARQTWSPAPIDLSVSSDKVYLVLYGTGIRHKAGVVTCLINGQPVPVTYAGAQSSFVGLDQVNVGPLPAALRGAGKVDISITVDGQVSNKVQVLFQ
jgi:uncharacterized protein (TIGR03437 family)